MDHLKIIKILYIGRLCEVNLLINTTSNELLVVKKIYLVNIRNLKEKNYIQNEIHILKKIKNHNNNIIKLYNIFQDEEFIYLYLEYCNGGTIKENLDKYIKLAYRPFPEKYIQHLMKQILLGVKFLHDNGIIHRDLKLNNILLKYNNDYNLNNLNILSAQVKIIDFNLSYIKNNSEPISAVGTLQNMAPSIIHNLNNNEKQNYDEKVDIWSLGTLCYEMLFGTPLFQNMTNEEICNNIINANVVVPKKNILIQAREFLYCMLQKDKNYRYSASQLLKHQFIIGDYHKFTIYRNNNKNTNTNTIKIINIPKVLMHYGSEENIKKKKNHNIKLYSPQKNQKICIGCNKILNDFYYKCLKCEQFLYCNKCYSNSILSNPHSHGFQILGGAFGSKIFDPEKVNKTFEIEIPYNKTINNHIPDIFNKKEIINVIFKSSSLKDIVIPFWNYEKLGKLIENYFYKIGRNDLIYNYTNKFVFIYNSRELNNRLDRQIGEIFQYNNNPVITIDETSKFEIKNKLK